MMNKVSWLFLIMLSWVSFSYASDDVVVTPIANFNSSQYLGNWYEIARLPNKFENKCSAPISANYSIDPDNSNQLLVVNRCNSANNQSDSADGVASFVESATTGKLKVTFLPKWLRWLPVGYGDYWVLYTDYNTVALVGSPDHQYMWILARDKDLNHEVLEKTLLIANDQGFDTTQLIFNNESEQAQDHSYRQ